MFSKLPSNIVSVQGCPAKINEAWPSLAAQYRGKKNSETVEAGKSQVLAVHVIHNLDAAVDLAEKSEVQISDEQKCTVQVEEAAVWDMLLDELAFRFLRAQRELFVEFLRGHLAFN